MQIHRSKLLLLSAWVVMVSAGLFVSLNYEKTPALTSPSANAAVDLKPKLGSKDYTLVLFAHPKCPCTQATIAELDRFLSRNNNVSTFVYFYRPEGNTDWENAANCQLAGKIPGLVSIADFGGKEAKRLNAKASGEVFLFNSRGKLLFQGGITGARGHEGDNWGLDQISAIVHGRPVIAKHAVYGCSLMEPASEKLEN